METVPQLANRRIRKVFWATMIIEGIVLLGLFVWKAGALFKFY